MFKTETHMHTAPVSACGRISPREMVRLYAEAGYATVFVSDHFAEYHFNKLGEHLPWERLMELFFGAYEEAKAVGGEYGVRVLLSPELSLHGNHFLIYGADRAFFADRPDIFEMSYEEFKAYAVASGVTVVQAHPFRDDTFTPHPECADAFEVVNTNPRHENYDEKAFELAKELGLPMTAGSDAHQLVDIAGAAMISEKPIESAEEYVDLLMRGKLKLMRHGEILEI